MARTETPPPRASPQVSHVASPIPAASLIPASISLIPPASPIPPALSPIPPAAPIPAASAAPVAEVTRIQAGMHRANGARQIARTIRARRRLSAVPDTADSGQVVRR